MANIKVGELRNLQKEFVKDIETINFHGLEIEVKQYLPIEKKLELAYTIYNSCVNTDNGLLVVSENSMDIMKTYFITQYYTNLTLPKDYFEGADLLISTGLYEVIKENIEDEISRLEDIIANIKIQELVKYEQENTYQNIIKNGINEFNNNLTELIKRLPTQEEAKEIIREVDKLDTNKLDGVVKGLFFNNGIDIDKVNENGIQNK